MYKKQVKHQMAFDRERELKAEKAAYRTGNIAMLILALVVIALLLFAMRNPVPKETKNVSHHIFTEP